MRELKGLPAVRRPLLNLLAQGSACLARPVVLSPVSLAATGGVPAVYATQAEAEEAARRHFNCSGAHRMGNQWMPCASHGAPPNPGQGGTHP
ncbi:MAG: hypothetical protein ACK5QW_06555 [Cyanobacteriota bacterium]